MDGPSALRRWVDLDGGAVNYVVPYRGNDAGVFLSATACVYSGGFMERGDNGHDDNALGERGKLEDCEDGVACRPRLVRKHDGVHELFGPGVLDLESLLVLESFVGERAHDVDGGDGMEIVSEARTDGEGTQLVRDGGATEGGGVN